MGTFRDHWQVVIIGGGQSGLSMGYYLKKKKVDFIILDGNDRIGDSWRKRWDSLLLFTPSQHDNLPGMAFPAGRGSFPTKREVADYLEAYALKFDLPVMNATRVNHIGWSEDRFIIDTSTGMIMADEVIVATGTNPSPRIPDFSREIPTEVFQIHSSEYRNPGSIPDGDVLVVGAGTSGVEIAIELSKSRKVYLSGKPTFHIPDNVFKYAGELYWWAVSNILTVKTPIGRKARSGILKGGGPLIRISADDLNDAGVELVPRTVGTTDGMPALADGRTMRISSVVWCTGYKPDFSWLDMNVTDDTGWPATTRGVSTNVLGLYFVGMPFQYGLTSGLLGGVGRDAAYISRRIHA